MKKQISVLLFFLLSIQFGFTSCTKKTAESNPNFSLTEFLIAAPWKVSYFKNGPNEITTEFENYTITFLSNGKIYAANSVETITGSWTNENSATQLNLLVNGNNPLPYLSKNWMVTSTENSTLILQENNSGFINELRLVRK